MSCPLLLRSCNDSSVEGIKSSDASGRKVWGCVAVPSGRREAPLTVDSLRSVQFHPEAAGTGAPKRPSAPRLTLVDVQEDLWM